MAVPAPPSDAVLPQVDPVITDQEFNSAIPALSATDDPELDKPLETIEAFEARMASEQKVAGEAGAASAASTEPASTSAKPTSATSTAQASGPAATNSASSSATVGAEQIGDAAITDPELTKPLPALGDFEVTPVQFTQAEDDAKGPILRYETKIEGLELADNETDINLSGEFKSLSALRKGDGKADNTAMLSARLTEDSQLVETILASEGWYSPIVRTRIDCPRKLAAR